MPLLNYLLVLLILWAAAMAYFFIARRLGIVDRPNHRTMHHSPTIRGGGIIFLLIPWLSHWLFCPINPYFLYSFTAVGVLSFVDDVRSLPSSIRMFLQFVAMGVIVGETGFYDIHPFWGSIVVLIGAGVLNAYNFMDGINGMTAGYSIVTIATLLLINCFVVPFASEHLMIVALLALLVFSFYNFRSRAACFAGDVGSVSMAFLVLYLLLLLIQHTGNYIFILLLALYGVDTVLTILHRMYHRENIFEAHRSHLFQIIVFHGKWRHISMSAAYMAVQLAVNGLILLVFGFSVAVQVAAAIVLLFLLSVAYVIIRRHYLKGTARAGASH
jgi:UDP-N-acetylmuramyl pentapeptide phosphotransferase/UDP-N-acetylglucosamine-1-phosphate transferase